MTTVKIGELRNNLSAYLRKVRKGGEIIIADREHPIGRLVPYQPLAHTALELTPPENGFANLAKLSFSDLHCDADPVAVLLEDRRRR